MDPSMRCECHPQVQSKLAFLEVIGVNPESITSLEQEIQNGIQFVSHDVLGMGAGVVQGSCGSVGPKVSPSLLSFSLFCFVALLTAFSIEQQSAL